MSSAQGLISPEYVDAQGNRVMVILNDDGDAVLMARAAGSADWEYVGEGRWQAETPAECRMEADRLAAQVARSRGWAATAMIS